MAQLVEQLACNTGGWGSNPADNYTILVAGLASPVNPRLQGEQPFDQGRDTANDIGRATCGFLS